MGKSRRNDLDALLYPDAVAVLGPFRDGNGLGCGATFSELGAAVKALDACARYASARASVGEEHGKPA